MNIRIILLLVTFLCSSALCGQTELVEGDSVYRQIDSISITPRNIHYIPFVYDIDMKIKSETQRWNIRTRADDYILYLPTVAVFSLEACNLDARNSYTNRFVYAAASHLFGSLSTHAMKRLIHSTRPDGRGNNSFPSGHTEASFVGAHLLAKEFGHHSPWISVSGYAVATTVAVLRIINNRHWFSDTFFGAALGILSVELMYWLLPKFFKGLDTENNPLSPSGVAGQSLSFGTSFSF